MKRQIITIDERKCNGCGKCIPGCPEGALQLIDGKARLISDLFCDGLGACLGECPVGAISVVEREAEPYDEEQVMENIVKAGPNTIRAHLKHLQDHGQKEYFNQAVAILKKKGVPVPKLEEEPCRSGGCPGSAARYLQPELQDNELINRGDSAILVRSELRQWPVQLHLINPSAPYLKQADLLISADCVPFAFADFHRKFVKGKVVITFCPKLDQGIENYIDKLARIFSLQDIRSVNIVRMEVPCCGGIEVIVEKALEKAGVSRMVRVNVISIAGEIA